MRDDSMYDMVWPPPEEEKRKKEIADMVYHLAWPHMEETKEKRKLNLAKDETVKQIIFDALHMKREMFPDMNVGQHSDYKSIYEELIRTYEKQ